MDYLKWLRSLKAGDEFAFDGGRYSPPEIYTVGRVTPTQIIVNEGKRLERRFCRTKGRLKGGSSYTRIAPVTDEIRVQIELSDLRHWMTYELPSSKPSLQVLRALKKAYDESIQQQEQT